MAKSRGHGKNEAGASGRNDMSSEPRVIYQGRIIRLALESVRLPNGARAELEIVHHPGGAAVVAIDAQRRTCLLRQYRHAAGGWLWNCRPASLTPGKRRSGRRSGNSKKRPGYKPNAGRLSAGS